MKSLGCSAKYAIRTNFLPEQDDDADAGEEDDEDEDEADEGGPHSRRAGTAHFTG